MSIVPREDDTLFNYVSMFSCSLLVLDLLAEDVFMIFLCSNRAVIDGKLEHIIYK